MNQQVKPILKWVIYNKNEVMINMIEFNKNLKNKINERNDFYAKLV